MSYKEWEKKYVSDAVSDKDRELYEKYKSVLKELSPESLEDFLDIKYNNSHKYAVLKQKYKDRILQDKIRKDYILDIETGKQGKHIKGHNNYQQGKSYLDISMEDVQMLVDQYAGTGILERDNHGRWKHTEVITQNKQNIGYAISFRDGKEYPTAVFKIHYSKNGTHIVPTIK